MLLCQHSLLAVNMLGRLAYLGLHIDIGADSLATGADIAGSVIVQNPNGDRFELCYFMWQ